jgi:hypothetical protein
VDIDVADFAALAPQAFIAEMCAGGDVRFRLAGEIVATLHGRPLRGESLLTLWMPEQRGRISRLLASALSEGEPLVVQASGVAAVDGTQARFELLFAPLFGPLGEMDRFLGLCQPETGSAGQARTGPLSLVTVNGVADAARRTRLRLAALDGRRIA